jgi:hypothetical protein
MNHYFYSSSIKKYVSEQTGEKNAEHVSSERERAQNGEKHRKMAKNIRI